MICSNCKKEVNDGANLCYHCGYQLSRKSISNRWYILCMIYAAILSTYGMFVLSSTPSTSVEYNEHVDSYTYSSSYYVTYDAKAYDKFGIIWGNGYASNWISEDKNNGIPYEWEVDDIEFSTLEEAKDYIHNNLSDDASYKAKREYRRNAHGIIVSGIVTAFVYTLIFIIVRRREKKSVNL